MPVTNALQFCKLVEQRLGWCPPRNVSGPDYRRYGPTAKRVKDRQAEAPNVFTWRNLELAVELLHRERKERSPLGVFANVERAIHKAKEEETPLDDQIREAMRIEGAKGDPDDWVTRFMRAQGAYRQDVLNEWKELQ